MSIEPFRTVRSRALLLLRDDVDTDQIIPARFLTTTGRTGLGRHLFADWRTDDSGAPRPAFPLNAAGATDARILVAGRNFGCGSSREHAPWALMDWGFRVVVAESFADIFRNNAQKNGLLTVALAADAHARLTGVLTSRPGTTVNVDLLSQSLVAGDATPEPFEVDPFARHCLVEGIDELDYLLAADREITRWERGAPVFVATTGDSGSRDYGGPAVQGGRALR